MSGSTAELDQAISILQGDLKSAPLTEVLSILNSFEQPLMDMGRTEIASSLSELMMALTTGNASITVIGRVMTRLGAQTISAASDADDPEFASKLLQVGQLLNAVGDSWSRPGGKH